MKKIIVIVCLLVINFSYGQTVDKNGRPRILFNEDWKFHLWNDSITVSPNYDDAAWQCTFAYPKN